ncbi:MAG TPA: HAMP domain-containing sensor histidine kinase [Chitinophagaceae bacterium]|jgi:signal transduction histidine kinase|nr:HAMP domain-containing sensor histidine kinase [Chitinophagaceae bacterium]
MQQDSGRQLRRATILFWILLSYIVAALVWWFISLERQNKSIFDLKRDAIIQGSFDNGSPQTREALSSIEDQRKRNSAKYISEGVTFLLLILLGAVFIYRLVRRQWSVQQQQQNFMMAVTHELKTPISVARLNLETLQKHSLDEEKKTKLLQSSLQETMRLDSLINNILVLSQLDAGAYRSSKEELDLSSLAEDVVVQFKTRYKERDLLTEIEKDVDLAGDPLLLKLLISNLLENAHKYSGKGSAILLRLSKRDSEVRLEVVDEGIGIAEEEKKNIFQKFYRIGNEETRKAQGTGLGLYLCKKIAADHKADVIVEDNEPRGSKFIVKFAA